MLLIPGSYAVQLLTSFTFFKWVEFSLRSSTTLIFNYALVDDINLSIKFLGNLSSSKKTTRTLAK